MHPQALETKLQLELQILNYQHASVHVAVAFHHFTSWQSLKCTERNLPTIQPAALQ